MKKLLFIFILIIASNCFSQGLPADYRNTFQLTDTVFQVGQIHVCKYLYYDFDCWGIRTKSLKYLDSVISFLQTNRHLRIEVSSHTDTRGSQNYNSILSQRRAESVIKYFIRKGIQRNRLAAKGYGETMPINDCDVRTACQAGYAIDCPCHQKNRRTELKIIEIQAKTDNVRSALQTFAPIGAKWYYALSHIVPGYITYKIFESVQDTIVGSKNCRKIEVTYFPGGSIAGWHYMYSDSNRVYFFADKISSWCLLYDFNISAGDSFELPCFTNGVTGKPLVAYVDSISQVNINGQNRKVQYITCGDGLSVEFNGPVIEGIGNNHFMFPTLDNIIGPWDAGFRCYEDSVVGLYKNKFFKGSKKYTDDCDVILVGIEENELVDDNIKVYPVPSQNEVIIESGFSLKYIELYDLRGRLVMQTESINSINISQLPDNMYLLRLIDNNGKSHIKKIIKYSN